jgi:hypothetical protein
MTCKLGFVYVNVLISKLWFSFFVAWTKCDWEIFESRDLNLNVDKMSFKFEHRNHVF